MLSLSLPVGRHQFVGSSAPNRPAVRMASPPFGSPSNPLFLLDPLTGIPPESSPGSSSPTQSYFPPLTVGGASQRRSRSAAPNPPSPDSEIGTDHHPSCRTVREQGHLSLDFVGLQDGAGRLGGWQALRFVRGLLPTLRIGSDRGQVFRFSTACPRVYPVQEEVLSLRGRYGRVTETLGVKETRITDGGRTVRYLLCRDTERVAEDQAVRQEIVAHLQEELEGSRTAEAHTRKACTLLAHRGYARYLREIEKGGLEID